MGGGRRVAAAVWLAAGLLGAAVRPVAADTTPGPDIVCWTDDQGVRSCGDHVPPQYAKKTREVYNHRGVEVNELPREETPEERAARLKREQEQADQLEARQRQAAHDSYLLESYRDLADLETARDGRLQDLDTRIQLAEKAVADGDTALANLHARVDSLRDKGKEPDERLLKQVQTFEASHSENLDALARLKQQRVEVAARFDADIKRYIALRSQQLSTP